MEWTKDQERRLLQWDKDRNGTLREVAAELGVSYDAASSKLARLRKKVNKKEVNMGDYDTPEDLPSGAMIGDLDEMGMNADGSFTTKRMMLLSTSDRLDKYKVMQYMGLDPFQWSVKRYNTRRNYWDTTMKLRKVDRWDEEGQPVYVEVPEKWTNHAFAVELSVEPIQDILSIDVVKKVFAELEAPKIKRLAPQTTPTGLMLELPLMDVHFGATGLVEEGGARWDLDTAEEVVKQLVGDIADRVEREGHELEYILLPIGQDFWHIDNVHGTTTLGTPVRPVDHWSSIYKRGLELQLWIIDRLRSIAPIKVMYVPGNHDQMVSYTAIVHIEKFYETADDVEVISSFVQRKYWQHGLVMLCHTHGRDEKPRLDKIMQAEQASMWGDTIWREVHCGDKHHEMAKEYPGVVVRRFPAISAKDEYAVSRGFIGTQRKLIGLLWDRNLGPRGSLEAAVAPVGA